jgi:hypothetical protein
MASLEETSNMRNLMGAAVVSLSLVACGGESSTGVDDNGPSGPVILHGQVVGEADYVLPNAEVLLVWFDFSQGGKGVSFVTTARAPVEAQSPRRFTLTVPGPPPDAVYQPELEPIWGTRFASGMFKLVEPGTEIRRNADPGILASTHNYLLTYAEGKGEARITAPDGGVGAVTVPKGFSLVRQDMVRCAEGYDQSCIERKVAMGFSRDWAKSGCAINAKSITHPVGVPVDSEMVLTVRDPNVPPADYTIPCP